MGLFEEWTRRHLAADPQEPASPPRPADVSAAIPLVTEGTTTPLDDPVPPSTMQVIRDVERLQAEYQERSFNTGPDYDRLPVTPMTLADVYSPYSISAQTEEDLMLWTEEHQS